MAISDSRNGHQNESSPLLREHDSPGGYGTPTVVLAREPNRSKSNNSPYLIDVSRVQFWLIFGPILLAYFVSMFDSYLMASSHPVITSYFHASNAASWLSTSFMLTSTACQPIFGRLSDTVGRRPVYLWALAGFAATTAWCAAAPTIGSFIAGRALCGIAAGGVMAMGGIMTNDLVKIEVRGTYQAYINILYGAGASFGAAFGGFLCDRIGWRWTFAIQVPPVLAILVCTWYTVPSDLGPQLAKNSDKSFWEIVREFDLAGSFFLILSVAFLILGLNLGGNVFPWIHPLIIASLIIAAVAGGILIWVESRALRPVMPLAMLVERPRANLVFANFFSMIGINHVIFNAPLYFEAVHGESPTVAGFRLGLPQLITTMFAVGCGFWLTWTGRMKAPQVCGAISMIVGGVCLSLLPKTNLKWLATLFVVPAPLGQALMFPATTVSVLAISAVEDLAVMTSTLMLWRNLGIVMGVAISSLVLQNALVANLNQFVTGPHKEEIIDKVRKSVKDILDLHGKHREEVVMAYSAALRITFISAVCFFILVNVLILPVELPWLGREKVNADVEEE